jgi:hypothetical protein
MHNRKLWYGLAALAAAWFFDFLFWGTNPGISLLIWVTALLLFGVLLTWGEKKKPSGWSILVAVLVLGFALLFCWRSESLTRFVSFFMVLGGLFLLIATYTTGFWTRFKLLDYVTELGKTIWAGMSRGLGLLIQSEPVGMPLADGAPAPKKNHRLGSVLLGIVIALPLLLILGLLLTSADPIFNDLLAKWFDIKNLPQYLFRFIYVVIGAYVLIGLYLHALQRDDPTVPDPDKPSLAPFLGPIEGGIVLGAIDVLFVAFVSVQVRYLFGGAANISATSYTYADYARKGFGELVAVAVISLLIYLIFNTITKRESAGAKVTFTVLSVLLITNVLVILASSLMRLWMYEEAYGFSELRTYTHLFIFWLAGLLVASIVLELVHKRGYFGLALLVMVVGYSATLGLINVDRFVAQANLDRAAQGQDLDVDYLISLSNDAVPLYVQTYLDSSQPQAIHDDLGAVLACRVVMINEEVPSDWRAFRIGRAQAQQLLAANSSAWSQYQVTLLPDGSQGVTLQGVPHPCFNYGMID